MQPQSKGYARARGRSFKCALSALIWLAVLSSCVTQRRCLEKFPPLPPDTLTVCTTTYRDTTVYVPMPADTVRDSIPVQLPCPQAANYKSDAVRAVGKYATAAAWLESGQLKIHMTMNDVKLQLTIDSAIKANTKTVTITKSQVLEKRFVPPFYRATLFVSIFLVLLVLGLFFILLRR
jgi:hypothetical protein